MQTLVIGDIHGCHDELQELLEKAGLGDVDIILSIGDCVDRGPATPAVLSFFKEQPNARLIMGNHERKHVRASRHEVKPARSQTISKLQFGENYPDALAYMSALPLYFALPEALIVHGFFEPGLPVDQQSPQVVCGTMGGDRYMKNAYPVPWYELYEGDKPILVGHHNYSGTDQPFIYKDRVFGLDTDCVTGKALTGLILPSFRFVSVPSRANHWQQVRSLYPETRVQHHPARVEIHWETSEIEELHQLIKAAIHDAGKIMQELENDSPFNNLPPRKQAKQFTEKAGTGVYATLLHLARLHQLDEESAKRVLKSPDNMKEVLSQHSETK